MAGYEFGFKKPGIDFGFELSLIVMMLDSFLMVAWLHFQHDQCQIKTVFALQTGIPLPDALDFQVLLLNDA